MAGASTENVSSRDEDSFLSTNTVSSSESPVKRPVSDRYGNSELVHQITRPGHKGPPQLQTFRFGVRKDRAKRTKLIWTSPVPIHPATAEAFPPLVTFQPTEPPHRIEPW